MKRTKDYRRFKNKVKENKAFSKYINSCYYKDNEELAREKARKTRDNLKVCSCWMCGNPRNSKGYKGKAKLTMQELKALDIFKSQTTSK